MNGLLSRVLQRATHPGGGLEPLRTSRATLRGRIASSTILPTEEVRELDAHVSIAGSAVERKEISARPILPMSAKTTGDSFQRHEERESGSSHAVPQQRVKQSPADATENESSRETFADREVAKMVVAVVGESPEPEGDATPKELRRERSKRIDSEAPKSPRTREQMLAVSSRHGVESQESSQRSEPQLPSILEISIGHIEVQAAVKAPERPRTQPFRPRVSLHDFLTRSGRR